MYVSLNPNSISNTASKITSNDTREAKQNFSTVRYHNVHHSPNKRLICTINYTHEQIYNILFLRIILLWPSLKESCLDKPTEHKLPYTENPWLIRCLGAEIVFTDWRQTSIPALLSLACCAKNRIILFPLHYSTKETDPELVLQTYNIQILGILNKQL